MNTRLLWNAAPLVKPKDIWFRALFRLLWCSVGGTIVLVIDAARGSVLPVRLVVALVLVIVGIGGLVDAFRLLGARRHS